MAIYEQDFNNIKEGSIVTVWFADEKGLYSDYNNATLIKKKFVSGMRRGHSRRTDAVSVERYESVTLTNLCKDDDVVKVTLYKRNKNLAPAGSFIYLEAKIKELRASVKYQKKWFLEHYLVDKIAID